MDGNFFLEQIAKLLSIPVCRYRREEDICRIFGREEAHLLTEGDREAFFRLYTLSPAGMPVLRVVDREWLLAEFQGGEEEWILLGPFLPAPAKRESVDKLWKRHREWEKLGLFPSVCRLDRFVTGVILAFGSVTGRELSEAEFWEYNKERFDVAGRVESRLNLDMFYDQEYFGLHNPYDQEQREMGSIENGNLEGLKRSMNETYEGQIGILANDPLRHHKNVAVGNITLASRAAIAGGVSVEKSFSMADSLIRQMEELRSVPEVEMFKREAKCAYARAVEEELQKDSGGVKIRWSWR